MVSEKLYSRIFPGIPYTKSSLDQEGLYEEFIVPQLKPGVVRSIDAMAEVLLKDYHLDKVHNYLESINIDHSLAIFQDYPHPGGWYSAQTGEAVENPLGKTLVLDCETFVQGGAVPVMAVAISENGLYLWTPKKLGDLITVEKGSLIIAHKSSYEACRIEQAFTGEALFLDTLTMATQCFGLASGQNWVKYKAKSEENKKKLPRFASASPLSLTLDSIHEFLGFGHLDKSVRDTFVIAETYEEILEEFQELLRYNILDVVATIKVFAELYRRYTEKAPHKSSLYGLISSCSYRLPLAKNWDTWVKETNVTYDTVQSDINHKLWKIAEQWVEEGPNPNNPWKDNLDWTIKPGARKNKGQPEWIRTTEEITIKSNLAPFLLELTYRGYPIEYHRTMGWYSEAGKVPHPSGKGNVGYLFSKDLLDLYKKGDLASKNPQCQEILEQAMQLSYWTSVRGRVDEQCVFYVGDIPWCIPQIGGGTITGRVTDPLWLTASDAKPNRIGSELKSRITAPDGYKFLNADFSSQEMRIAAACGDSIKGRSGSTEMSHALFMGNKVDKTDPHSRTATTIAEHIQKYIPGGTFDRDAAKGINFALLYMAGVKTVADGIYKNSGLGLEESEAVAKTVLDSIRGQVFYFHGTKEYKGGTNSESYMAIDGICNKEFPRTPVLAREMSDPLCPAYVRNDYYTTRANWVIQGTARDLLDLLVTAFEFMCQHYKVNARVTWSRHDEVIVLVKDDDVQRAAELLQIAHVYCWAALHEELGLYDIPNKGLLFDGVEVDTVVRKGPKVSCLSPSNFIEPLIGQTIWDFSGLDRW